MKIPVLIFLCGCLMGAATMTANAQWTWNLDMNDGTLTMGGSGAMDNYEATSWVWYNNRNSIHAVVIGNSVKHWETNRTVVHGQT
jgi:hypothetical protein